MNDNLSDSSCKKQPNVRHYADGTASVICLDMVTVLLIRWYKQLVAQSRILLKAVLMDGHLQRPN